MKHCQEFLTMFLVVAGAGFGHELHEDLQTIRFMVEKRKT